MNRSTHARKLFVNHIPRGTNIHYLARYATPHNTYDFCNSITEKYASEIKHKIVYRLSAVLHDTEHQNHEPDCYLHFFEQTALQNNVI